MMKDNWVLNLEGPHHELDTIHNQPVPTGINGFNFNNIKTNGDQVYDVVVPKDSRLPIVVTQERVNRPTVGTPPPLTETASFPRLYSEEHFCTESSDPDTWKTSFSSLDEVMEIIADFEQGDSANANDHVEKVSWVDFFSAEHAFLSSNNGQSRMTCSSLNRNTTNQKVFFEAFSAAFPQASLGRETANDQMVDTHHQANKRECRGVHTLYSDQKVPPKNNHQKTSKKASTPKEPRSADAGKAKTKHRNRTQQDLMRLYGIRNVFIGKGGPCCQNQGNKYYRSVIDKHYPEYMNASNNKRRDDIKIAIQTEILNSRCHFYIIEKARTTEEDSNSENCYEVSYPSSDVITERIGKSLRDSPKRFDKYWHYWIGEATNDQGKRRFGSAAATKLEEMYHKNAQDRSNIELFMNDEKYLIDWETWRMRKFDNPRILFQVQRMGPDTEMEGI